MELSAWVSLVLTGTTLLAAMAPPPDGDLYEVDVRELARVWERVRVSPEDPSTLRHDAMKAKLGEIVAAAPAVLRLETAGSSVENREIFLVTAGSGPRKILLWSQMHGDEPTATSALLDLFQFLASHHREAWVARILETYTLLFVPMLNPDGAERNMRRNAQGIDVNRDARALQTPEGRILKSLRDRFEPFLGFNLHNQMSTTTLGDTGRVATISLLAVAVDRAAGRAAGSSDDPLLTRRVTAVLYEALSPFVYGHIGRYDETFNPRAFGDNFTLWGTPVVLIESGGHPAGAPPGLTVQLNFVGILAALDSLATNRIVHANPAIFDALRLNSDVPIFDLVIRDAWIVTGTGVPAFRGDVAVRRDARAGSRGEAVIADVGDLHVFSAHQTIDASGMLLTPGLIGWEPLRSAVSEPSDGRAQARRGFTTVLETVSQEAMREGVPAAGWTTGARAVNWSFVIEGSSIPESLAADWLAAGGRGWIYPEQETAQLRETRQKVAGWFGLDALPRTEALRHAIPESLEGEPATAIVTWASQAARRFRIPRRGTITVGNVADLVLWTAPDGDTPQDLSRCRPSRIILNGRVVDLDDDELPRLGRFLGR